MSQVTVHVYQQSATTSKGTARQHEVLIDRPEAKEGSDAGPMGGELFLMALGGCFMSTLLAAVRSRELPVSNVGIEVVATVGKSPKRFTDIELKISAEYEDKADLEKLVIIARRGCLVVNSLQGAVNLTFTVN